MRADGWGFEGDWLIDEAFGDHVVVSLAHWKGVLIYYCVELDALATLFEFLRHGRKVLFAFYDNMLHLITTTD